VLELMRRPILNHTERGEVVYDPFLGSGTAMIAAEVTGRICYGVEIEPRYVDVAVLRGIPKILCRMRRVSVADGQSTMGSATARTVRSQSRHYGPGLQPCHVTVP
jgi:DNA modification methylase